MASGFFTTFTSDGSSLNVRSTLGVDMNNDGLGDVVYGDAELGVGNGTITVLYGSAGGFDETIDVSSLDPSEGFSLDGTVLDGEFGWSLGSEENFDGSGNNALFVGSRLAGTVSVVYSGSTDVGLTITGLPVAANGLTVSGIGDFNGDGLGDVAIGAPDANFGAGEVYVIFGSASFGSTFDVGDLNGTNGFTISGFTGDDAAGTSITALGNIDGVAGDDFLIGVPGDDDNGLQAGNAVIVSGGTGFNAVESVATSTNLSLDEFTGQSAGDEFGRNVSGGFDVDGNGINDLVIGADLADPNGAGSGVAYVIYDSANFGTDFDLATLDGMNGYAIEGLSAGDRLGASVSMLGDVSGDGLGDVGVLTASGDFFVIFGSNANNGGSVDLANLDRSEGYSLTGLFSSTPTSVSLVALPDINSDTSGAIADIAISAQFGGGAPSQSISLLGGTANLAALDAADGTVDGQISFDQITGPVDFPETNDTIQITGNFEQTITEDTPSVSAAIGITDTSGVTSPSFAGRSAAGVLGVFAINGTGDIWTYTVNDNAALQYLGLGQSITDRASVTASNGAQQEIVVLITGLDDPAVASGNVGLGVNEDSARTSGVIALNDPDADDNPSLAGVTGVGTFGYITVANDGSYVYFLTSAAIEALGAGQTATDTVTLVASDGSSHDVTVTFTGAAEGIAQNFDGGDNEIYTSFGDDIINALGGNDTIDAGAGNDVINAGSGDDVIRDQLGDSTVSGDQGNDVITLTTGNNEVDGGTGSDFIQTGYQDDTIFGGTGNDVIAAEEGAIFAFGNNEITGGTGDDVMMGGAGIDRFIFRPNDGTDIIGAFDVSNVGFTAGAYFVVPTGAAFDPGIDKIALNGFTSVDASNVLSAVTNGAGGAVFSAEGTSILLFGLNSADLGVDDFEFG